MASNGGSDGETDRNEPLLLSATPYYLSLSSDGQQCRQTFVVEERAEPQLFDKYLYFCPLRHPTTSPISPCCQHCLKLYVPILYPDEENMITDRNEK
jgi:hypothetical protein